MDERCRPSKSMMPFARNDSARMMAYQQGLPLGDPEGERTANRQSAPARADARRAVHVSGYDREGRDFYATPSWVTEALLRHVRLRDPVWEPCCGDGAMSSVRAAHRYEVISTDLVGRGFGTPGIDFMACRHMHEGCRSIVTNPPYGDTGSHKGQAKSSAAMLAFLQHAVTLTASAQGQLALLVRLQWIAGRRAADVLSSGPFAAVVILTRRIRWFEMVNARTVRSITMPGWCSTMRIRPVLRQRCCSPERRATPRRPRATSVHRARSARSMRSDPTFPPYNASAAQCCSPRTRGSGRSRSTPPPPRRAA